MAVSAVLLGVLLLVVFVEGEAGAANGDGGGDAFLDLVGVRVLGPFLAPAMTVPSWASCSMCLWCFSSLRQSVTLGGSASPAAVAALWCLPRKWCAISIQSVTIDRSISVQWMAGEGSSDAQAESRAAGKL
jgi:hypothetical protein